MCSQERPPPRRAKLMTQRYLGLSHTLPSAFVLDSSLCGLPFCHARTLLQVCQLCFHMSRMTVTHLLGLAGAQCTALKEQQQQWWRLSQVSAPEQTRGCSKSFYTCVRVLECLMVRGSSYVPSLQGAG